MYCHKRTVSIADILLSYRLYRQAFWLILLVPNKRETEWNESTCHVINICHILRQFKQKLWIAGFLQWRLVKLSPYGFTGAHLLADTIARPSPSGWHCYTVTRQPVRRVRDRPENTYWLQAQWSPCVPWPGSGITESSSASCMSPQDL